MGNLKNYKNFGFTLIELLAVIIILAIVALIAIPIILDVVEDARISAGKSEAQMILGGINNYCATEDVKYQLDSNYTKICTTDMDVNDVPTMVNLGNATIESIKYNGTKLTELVIKSNNHTFTLCSNGQFVMDDEECDGIAVITTGPIKDVVLSNFPYLETNGNGCVTPTANNYSYMGGCYLKGGSQSGKDIFIEGLKGATGLDSIEIINQKFFDSEGKFKSQEFESWYRNFMKEQGMSDEQIDQALQESGKNTIFEAAFGMTPEELFAMQPLNNSIWYSGFLWRIMGINADGTVRLITDEILTYIPYGSEGTAENWDGSYAKDWLNNYFYPRLKGNNIIVEQTWCSETTTDENSVRTTCLNNLSTEKAKVGLITLDEYNLATLEPFKNSYINLNLGAYHGGEITMTPYSNSDIWRLRYSTVDNSSVSNMYGMRAVINIKPDVNITGGNGILGSTWCSEIGPYILNEDKNVEAPGELNKIATSGEYVMFAGKKYRVVDKDDNGNTKLILDGYYDEETAHIYIYGDDNIFSTTVGIGKVLNSNVLDWLVAIDDTTNRNKLVTDYTWYQNNFNYGFDYRISLEQENPTRIVNATVGLIRIGEMISGHSGSILTKGYTDERDWLDAYAYWTMTIKGSFDAWNILGNMYSDGRNIFACLRPVIIIKSDVEIISGTGTFSNPYKI